MKKKVNIFGKGIPVFLLVLLGVGLVSAALVPYLSGLIVGTATVDSPTTLKWYDKEGVIINSPWGEDMTGGEEMGFFKVIKNDVLDKDVLFGLALIFKDTDGEGITVTSAGPCGGPCDENSCTPASRCVSDTGVPFAWDNECWCQDDEDDWYNHGQCFEYPSNAYDDAVKVIINDGTNNVDYYVVLFGATTDDTTVTTINGIRVATPNTIIRKLGWGKPLSDSNPCNALNEEGTTIYADKYDTGKVKVDYAINLDPTPDYVSVMEVVQPGQTLESIITDLENRDAFNP